MSERERTRATEIFDKFLRSIHTREHEAGACFSDSFLRATCPFLQKSSVAWTNRISLTHNNLIGQNDLNFQCRILCTVLSICPHTTDGFDCSVTCYPR